MLVYISKSMPPLPANAGFWSAWLYKIVKGASGLDPNKSLLDANVLRVAGVDEATLKSAER